jgi:hypothetical protein
MRFQLPILIMTVAVITTACYDDKDPVADIMEPTGKGFYPTSSNTLTDLLNAGTISTNRTYKQNVDIAFELQYWSEGAIREINLYSKVGAATKQKIYSGKYTDVAAFSKIKSADTLVLRYTTPAVASKTTVSLEVEIVNENELTLVRTLTIASEP